MMREIKLFVIAATAFLFIGAVIFMLVLSWELALGVLVIVLGMRVIPTGCARDTEAERHFDVTGAVLEVKPQAPALVPAGLAFAAPWRRRLPAAPPSRSTCASIKARWNGCSRSSPPPNVQ